MLTDFLYTCAVLAFLFILFEERSRISKAKSTLFFGSLAWIGLFVDSVQSQRAGITDNFNSSILEIACLWLFLVSSMTFVAYINRRGLIDALMRSMLPDKLSTRNLFYSITLFAYLFSLLCDNATTALVVSSVVVPLELDDTKRLNFATSIIFAVTAAGVALITGDVTTIMVFMAGKVQIAHLLLLGMAAFVAVCVLALLLARNMEGEVDLSASYARKYTYDPIDILIAVLFIATLVATMLLNIYFTVPPVLTFLCGLSVMLIVGSYRGEDQIAHMLDYIREIEFDSLLFFLGVMLLVGMLARIHALESIADIYRFLPTELTTYLIGLLAGVVGNVPLIAAVLKAGIVMPEHDWLQLIYAVVMGGTLIITGSAAGIITMGKLRGVTMLSYFRNFAYLLFAYSVGFGVVMMLGPLME
jgi:Na+/H+ antiporter NhaD/arsenite permease-like protein